MHVTESNLFNFLICSFSYPAAFSSSCEKSVDQIWSRSGGRIFYNLFRKTLLPLQELSQGIHYSEIQMFNGNH